MSEQLVKAMKVSLTIFLCKGNELKDRFVFIYIPTYGINGIMAKHNICELVTVNQIHELNNDGEIEILVTDEWVQNMLENNWLVEKWRV